MDNGFVHCDPHKANILLREHPSKKGKPKLVLVDHGLYKTLDGDFQEAYARLWKDIVMADVDGIKSACGQLGVHKMVRIHVLNNGKSTHLPSHHNILFLYIPLPLTLGNSILS